MVATPQKLLTLALLTSQLCALPPYEASFHIHTNQLQVRVHAHVRAA